MLKKIETHGGAAIYKGDPRLPETNMDKWFGLLLTENYPAKARPHLYGSDAGLCARRNVLLEHNVWMAGEKTATSAAYMAIGVGLEDMLAKALERNGRLVAKQLKLPLMPEVHVSGYADLVIFDSEDELALVEVKSCGKLPTEPRPTHLAQIQFYAAATGLHRAWLTYISRNVRSEYGANLDMRSFPIDCSEKALRSRLATAAQSRLAADAAKLPPVPAHFRKHEECHYCEFRDAFCWQARPGLGGGSPQPPLIELSPKEMVELERESLKLSESMWYGSEERLKRLLESLLSISLTTNLSLDNLKRLRVSYAPASV
jgi:PD-(D/E)XK nuclease superfamily